MKIIRKISLLFTLILLGSVHSHSSECADIIGRVLSAAIGLNSKETKADLKNVHSKIININNEEVSENELSLRTKLLMDTEVLKMLNSDIFDVIQFTNSKLTTYSNIAYNLDEHINVLSKQPKLSSKQYLESGDLHNLKLDTLEINIDEDILDLKKYISKIFLEHTIQKNIDIKVSANNVEDLITLSLLIKKHPIEIKRILNTNKIQKLVLNSILTNPQLNKNILYLSPQTTINALDQDLTAINLKNIINEIVVPKFPIEAQVLVQNDSKIIENFLTILKSNAKLQVELSDIKKIVFTNKKEEQINDILRGTLTIDDSEFIQKNIDSQLKLLLSFNDLKTKLSSRFGLTLGISSKIKTLELSRKTIKAMNSFIKSDLFNQEVKRMNPKHITLSNDLSQFDHMTKSLIFNPNKGHETIIDNLKKINEKNYYIETYDKFTKEIPHTLNIDPKDHMKFIIDYGKFISDDIFFKQRLKKLRTSKITIINQEFGSPILFSRNDNGSINIIVNTSFSFAKIKEEINIKFEGMKSKNITNLHLDLADKSNYKIFEKTLSNFISIYSKENSKIKDLIKSTNVTTIRFDELDEDSLSGSYLTLKKDSKNLEARILKLFEVEKNNITKPKKPALIKRIVDGLKSKIKRKKD